MFSYEEIIAFCVGDDDMVTSADLFARKNEMRQLKAAYAIKTHFTDSLAERSTTPAVDRISCCCRRYLKKVICTATHSFIAEEIIPYSTTLYL